MYTPFYQKDTVDASVCIYIYIHILYIYIYTVYIYISMYSKPPMLCITTAHWGFQAAPKTRPAPNTGAGKSGAGGAKVGGIRLQPLQLQPDTVASVTVLISSSFLHF